MRFKRDFLAIFANYRNFFTFTTVIGVLLEILRGGGGINARGLKISLAYCNPLYCEPVGLLIVGLLIVGLLMNARKRLW